MILQRAWRGYAPPWFRARWVSTFYESIGAMLDTQAQRVLDGRLAAIPYAGADPGAPRLSSGQRIECQPDALPYHSADRGITLYQTEPIVSQRYRLSRWWQLWRTRGTHIGEILNLRPFFLGGPATALGVDGNFYPTPWIRVVFQDNLGTPGSTWIAIDPSGTVQWHRVTPSNFNYDGQPSKRTRFWVVVYLPPGYSSEITYDSGAVFDGGAIYDGVTSFAIADMVAAIKEAKAAHSRLAALILTNLQPTDDIPGHAGRHPFDPSDTSITLSDGSTSLPTGNWGSIVGPTNNPTRPPWASWVYEDNP